MKNQYRTQLNHVKLTDADKNILVYKMMDAQRKVQNRRKDLSWRMIATLVVVVCLFTATAGALIWYNTLSPLWAEGSQVVYEENKMILNKSQTIDGWTVTLTDCIGNDTELYIGVELTAPEGADMTHEYYFDDYTMTFTNGNKDRSGGVTRIGADAVAGNTIHYGLWKSISPRITRQQPVHGETVTITLDQLFYVSWKDEDIKNPNNFSGSDECAYISVVDKPFVFENVKLDYPDAGKTYAVNQQMEYLGGRTTLERIEIDPFGVTAYISGGSALHHHDEKRAENGEYLFTDIKVYGKGDALLYERYGGGTSSHCNQNTGKSEIYHKYLDKQRKAILIDPKEISAVEVNDVKIQISK